MSIRKLKSRCDICVITPSPLLKLRLATLISPISRALHALDVSHRVAFLLRFRSRQWQRISVECGVQTRGFGAFAMSAGMDNYEKLEKVGEGTYGKVYKARDKRSGQLVALKKTRLEMEEEGVPSTALREVSLLQMLSHSMYIVRLLCVEHVEKNNKPMLYLVFEYMDTDLKKYIDLHGRGPSGKPLPVKVVQSFMYQLCTGLAHCHGHGVMHRDLKPQNLLVDKQTRRLKIADLGLGRAFTVPMKSYTHEIVTLWYRAPEVLLGATHYSLPVDMWSVGCIFAELVRKMPLFTGDSELQQLLHIFRLLGTPNETIWPGVSQHRDWHEFPQWRPQDLSLAVPGLSAVGLDLLAKMLVFEPSKRISAKAALSHPYFADLDKTAT